MRNSTSLWLRAGLLLAVLIAVGLALYFTAAWMLTWWAGLEPLWGMVVVAAVSLWIAARIVAAGMSHAAKIHAQERLRASKLNLYQQELDALLPPPEGALSTDHQSQSASHAELLLQGGAEVLRQFAAIRAGLAANQVLRADDVQSLIEAMRKDLGCKPSALNAVQLQQILDPRSTG